MSIWTINSCKYNIQCIQVTFKWQEYIIVPDYIFGTKDTTRMTDKIIKKGSQVFRKAGKLTYFPCRTIPRASQTMFQDDEFLYFIWFREYATCEWQLSQQRLCIRALYTSDASCMDRSQPWTPPWANLGSNTFHEKIKRIIWIYWAILMS